MRILQNVPDGIAVDQTLLLLAGGVFVGSILLGVIIANAITTLRSLSNEGEEVTEDTAEEAEASEDTPEDEDRESEELAEVADEMVAATDSEDAVGDEIDDDMGVLDTARERQLSSLAPEFVEEDEENYEFLRTEDTHIRSYFIADWPEAVGDGHLEDIFSRTSDNFDVSIHIDPVDTKEAMETLKDQVRDLEADLQLAQENNQTLEARDLKRQYDDYEGMRQRIRDGDAEMVDVSMYVSVAADSERELDQVSDQLETDLEKNGLTPVLVTKDQERAHMSTSPILKDELQRKRSMMGGSVGALMPFSSGTMIQEQGIVIGEHAKNGSPIIYDRFEHDRGYNWLTIGNIGAGKSFSTKVHLARRRLYDPNTIIVMLDPLEGFAGLNEALDGEHVLVSGEYGLNPMEIKKVPDEVLENNPQLNPGGAKLKDLKSFFESYFELRNEELGERWDTLQRAIQKAYERRGIDLNNPETHGRENPTIQDDLVPVLLNMVTDIQDHTILHDIVDDEETISTVIEEAQEVTDEEQQRAAELLLAMEPFMEGGEMGNMGMHSDLDIEGEDVIYLDLQQQEARGSLGLMMNLLFSSVYERAKQSDRKIIFAIDEARYIMRDQSALEFLEQAIRHSRHYDLSIQFITQTVDEFFQHPEAEAIADQCDHKLFFHTQGMEDEIAEKVGMNELQAQFVRNATPGDSERGYSEAAFGVADEGYFPVHVRASDTEAAVVDLEPSTDIREALPGMEGEEAPEEVQAIRQHLLEKYNKDVEINLAPKKAVPEITVTDEDGTKAVVQQEALQVEDPGEQLKRIIETIQEEDEPEASGKTEADD